LLRLTSRLAKDGHQVRVILGADGPLRAKLEAAGIEVKVHPRLAVADRRTSKDVFGIIGLLVSFCVSTAYFWGVYSRFRPDIVHTNTALILTPGLVAKLRGIPHVWHVREVFSDVPGWWRWYQWYVVFFATQIVCISKTVASQFSSRIGPGKIVVVYNGLPESEFSSVPPERIRAFRELYQLDGKSFVGLVGRIKLGRKGQDILLHAANELAIRFPDARFLMIGSPFPGNEAHLERLQALIRESGLQKHVICTGDVEDIQAAYASLNISVQASVLPEAFGGVIVESMAMGKPTVGTTNGGNREQIVDGVTGYLVPPGVASDLAAALAKLLSDPALCERLGQNGRARFLSEFEFEPFYRRIIALYFSCLRSAGAGEVEKVPAA